MNQELELVENKNADQGLTELVGRHPAKGSGFVALGNFPFDGDNFPTDVAETGASAALVSDPPRAMKSPSALSLLQVQSPSPLSLLQVQGNPSTLLHKIAPSYRQLMPLRPVWN